MSVFAVAQENLRRTARAVARQQAWTDRRGVRGLPVRLAGQDYPEGQNTDLTVLDDLIDSATTLVWRGEELTCRSRLAAEQHIAIMRPGFDRDGRDGVEIMGSADLDWMLQLAEADAAAVAGRGEVGSAPVMSVMTCLASDCGLIGHPYPGRAEALALAGIHNSVHHGGAVVAEAGLVVAPCWEIDGPDGTALYRVENLDLANDLFQMSPPGSHLVAAMAVTPEVR